MKINLKRIICLTLCIAMTLSLVGCGDKKGKNKITINKNAIYREETIPFETPENYNSYGSGFVNGCIYSWGMVYNEDYSSNKFVVITANADGSDVKTTTLDAGTGWIENIFITSDRELVYSYSEYEEYMEDENDPESWTYNNHYYMCKADTNGKVLKKIDLHENEGIEYLDFFYYFENVGLVFGYDNSYYLLDDDLKIAKKVAHDPDVFVYTFYRIKNGEYLTSYWGTEKQEFAKFDPQTLKLSDPVDMSMDFMNYSVFSGDSNYDLYLNDGVSVYGYNLGDTEPSEIMNMVDSDLSTAFFEVFAALGDGSFLGTYSNWDEVGYSYQVSRLSKVNPEDVVEKTVLSLGCVYMDSELRQRVIKFNKTNPDYRISVKDYRTYDTEENWNGGIEKLNSDIASGNCPDIIFTNDISLISSYASKGLFKDLYPFIEKDPDIDKDDIFPNLLEATEYNGKLYQLVPSFYIETMVGKKSLLGDRDGWTTQEMLDFEKTLPENTKLFANMSRESFMNFYLVMSGNSIIDNTSGKCNFNTDEFKTMLEYSKSLPKDEDMYSGEIIYDYAIDYGYGIAENDAGSYETQWRENRTVLYPLYLSNPRDYKMALRGYLGEDMTFVGYPTADGNGGCLYFQSSLAISSKSKHADTAWEFIRAYLLKDYQEGSTWNIPALMSVYDKQALEATQRPFYNDENGNPIYYDDTFYMNNTEIIMDPLTEDDLVTLKNAILSVNKSASAFPEEVITIINEESQPFYEGQKSIDDVCNIIQSRVTIFINERR